VRRTPEKFEWQGQMYEIHPDGSVYARVRKGSLRRVKDPAMRKFIVKSAAAAEIGARERVASILGRR
jgi:hypothetical protein